jgi:hypothetical protein
MTAEESGDDVTGLSGEGEDESVPGGGPLGAGAWSQWQPVLTEVLGAAPEWVEAGRAYWSWDGFRYGPDDVYKATSRWLVAADDIAREHGVQSGYLYVLAAAGVTATLPSVTCPACGVPVALRGRGALDNLVNGGDPADSCGRCNDTLQSRLAVFTDPSKAAARKAERERAAVHADRQAAVEAARRSHAQVVQTWQSVRRNYLSSHHPVRLAQDGVPWAQLTSRCETEFAVLTLLRFAPSADPLTPVDSWEEPLTPTWEMGKQVLLDASAADLLRVDGEHSPLSAFAWEPDETTAVSAADGDVDGLPAPGWSGYWPTRAVWHAWQGPSRGTAVSALEQHLSARVQQWLTTQQGQHDVLRLATRLIATEGRRYFDYQLKVHNLPEVIVNHSGRLDGLFTRLAHARSLGQAYHVAWRSVRDAASAAQRTPGAPLERMTTHAVNQLEKLVTQATDPTFELQDYREVRGMPLSAMTRSLFHDVLHADPMAASVPLLRAGMPASSVVSLPVADTPDDEDGDEWGLSVEDAVEGAVFAAKRLDEAVRALVEDPRGMRLEETADLLYDDLPYQRIQDLASDAGASEADIVTAWVRLRELFGTMCSVTPNRAVAMLAVVAAADLLIPTTGTPDTAGYDLGVALRAYLTGLLRQPHDLD